MEKRKLVSSLIKFLELHNIQVILGNNLDININNKILNLRESRLDESLSIGFTKFFSVLIRNSFIERNLFKIFDSEDKEYVNKLICEELEGHIRWRLGLTQDYKSNYPQLFFYVRNFLFNIDTMYLFKPLNDLLTIDSNRLVLQTLNNINKNSRYVLTGSHALCLQGSVYRDNYSGINDLDIITDKDFCTIDSEIQSTIQNIIRIHSNDYKILYLVIPNGCKLHEYHIKDGSLVYYSLTKNDKEVGWYEWSDRRNRFIKSGEYGLLLDIVKRPTEQINEAIKIDGIHLEHYSNILKVKLEMDRLKDTMDYCQFKIG